MTLFSIILGLIVDKFLSAQFPQVRFTWFCGYMSYLHAKLSGVFLNRGQWGYLACMLPLLLVIAVVQFALDDIFWGLLEILFSVTVLFYCLSGEMFVGKIEKFHKAVDADDFEQAKEFAQDLLEEPLAENMSDLIQQVTKAVLIQANYRLFAVLFWFIIFGPIGAVFYRLNRKLSWIIFDDNEKYEKMLPIVVFIQKLLDWIPARLAAFTYLLVGNFASGFARWWSNLFTGLSDNHSVLAEAGLAARKNQEDEAQPANITWVDVSLVMVKRALIVWLVAIAIFTLGAWIY